MLVPTKSKSNQAELNTLVRLALAHLYSKVPVSPSPSLGWKASSIVVNPSPGEVECEIVRLERAGQSVTQHLSPALQIVTTFQLLARKDRRKTDGL